MTEIIMMLSFAKSLGFDLTRILEMAIIFFMVLSTMVMLYWRVMGKFIEATNRTGAAVEDLTKSFKTHLQVTDADRLETKKDIETIKTRVEHIEAILQH